MLWPRLRSATPAQFQPRLVLEGLCCPLDYFRKTKVSPRLRSAWDRMHTEQTDSCNTQRHGEVLCMCPDQMQNSDDSRGMLGSHCCTTGVAAMCWINTLRLRTASSPAGGRSASAWRESSARGGQLSRYTMRSSRAASPRHPAVPKSQRLCGVQALQNWIEGRVPTVAE